MRRISIADRPAVIFIELPAKLQFKGIHLADELLVHLLYQRGIPGEAPRIQCAHLIDERLQLRAGFRAVLHRGPNAVEQVQTLIDLALRIGGIRPLLRSRGAALYARIAGVEIACAVITSAIAGPCRGITQRTGLAVARLTELAASLAASLAVLGCLLAALTAAGLPVARKSAALELLIAAASLPGLLSLAGLTLSLAGISAQTRELIAQPREIVHRAIESGIFGAAALRGSKRARGILDLLPELLQIARQRSFERIGEIAAAQPIGAALQARAEIVLVEPLKRVAQLARSRRLGRRELADRRAHLLREMRKIVSHLLAVVDHFVDFLSRWILRLLAPGACGVHLRDDVAHVIGLLLLARGELVGRLRHGTETPGGILLLAPGEEVGRLAQAIGGAARIGGAGVLRSGALHVLIGLAEAIESLLRCLLAAVSSLLTAGCRRTR